MSNGLQKFFIVCMIGIPTLQVVSWGFFDPGHDFISPLSPLSEHVLQSDKIKLPLSPWTRLFGFGASLLLTIPSLLLCGFLSRLFGLFKKGDIFSQNTIRTIRRIGYCYLTWCLLLPVHEAFMSVALTFSNPPGQRFITVSLSNHHIEPIVTSLLIIVIAWIMEEAYKLKRQNALTI